MKKNKSKTELILDYLKTGKPITSIIALEEFNVTNLAGLLYKLHKRGYNFKKESFKTCNNKTSCKYYLTIGKQLEINFEQKRKKKNYPNKLVEGNKIYQLLVYLLLGNEITASKGAKLFNITPRFVVVLLNYIKQYGFNLKSRWANNEETNARYKIYYIDNNEN